jgi:hypothetical protein
MRYQIDGYDIRLRVDPTCRRFDLITENPIESMRGEEPEIIAGFYVTEKTWDDERHEPPMELVERVAKQISEYIATSYGL